MLYLVFGQETVKEEAVSMGMVWRREKKCHVEYVRGKKATREEKGTREGWEGDKVGEKQYKEHLFERTL